MYLGTISVSPLVVRASFMELQTRVVVQFTHTTPRTWDTHTHTHTHTLLVIVVVVVVYFKQIDRCSKNNWAGLPLKGHPVADPLGNISGLHFFFFSRFNIWPSHKRGIVSPRILPPPTFQNNYNNFFFCLAPGFFLQGIKCCSLIVMTHGSNTVTILRSVIFQKKSF